MVDWRLGEGLSLNVVEPSSALAKGPNPIWQLFHHPKIGTKGCLNVPLHNVIYYKVACVLCTL